jgi:hypothetical protein
VGSFNSATISFTIGNAAKASTEGVQASFDWMATDNLSFNGSVGYNRARYEDYENAACYVGQTAETGCVTVGGVRTQDLTGESLVRAPDLMFSLGADYRATLASGWTADFSADAAYTDDYMSATDNSPGGIQEISGGCAGVHLMPRTRSTDLADWPEPDERVLPAERGQPSGGTADQFVGLFNRRVRLFSRASTGSRSGQLTTRRPRRTAPSRRQGGAGQRPHRVSGLAVDARIHAMQVSDMARVKLV